MPATHDAPARHRSRLPGLDGLRGLAGVGVVLVHVWMYTGNNDPSQPYLLDKVIGELRLGLMAFFVLSAFLLFAPWAQAGRGARPAPRVRPFLLRRAARILPAYWFAILGAFAALAAVGSARAVPASDLPAFLLMAQTYFAHTNDQLVPPAWSLCVEITFYAVLPLLGWLAVRAGRRRGPVAAGLLIAAALIVLGTAWNAAAVALAWPVTVTTSLPTFLPIFACGIAAAVVSVPAGRGGRVAMLAAGAALVAANGVWHHDGTGAVGHVLRDLPAGAGFGLVVAALAAGPPGVLERRPIRWLGTVSYGTYLWHMPLIFVLREEGLLPAGAVAAFALVLAGSLALAALSWYGVERPALRWTAGARLPRRRPGSTRPWPTPTNPSTTTRPSRPSTARSGSSTARAWRTASSPEA